MKYFLKMIIFSAVFIPQCLYADSSGLIDRIDKLEAENTTLKAQVSEILAKVEELSLENKKTNERVSNIDQSLKYSFTHSDLPCPAGWINQGLLGMIMGDDYYKNHHIGGGGSVYTKGWTWTHPRLCKKITPF